MERDQATRFVHDLLKLLLSKKGSDLFLTAEFPPAFKVDGRVLPVSNQPLTAQHTAELVRAIMNDRQASEFESTKECNFAISPTGIGRFRVSAFVQQGKVGIVLRVIADHIPTAEELNLPTLINDLAMAKRGIVMVVGATGSGKSTTLAAMVGYRNENSQGHIITIEDPIEYVHPHKNCVITQRLIAFRDRKGRVPAVEVMLNSPLISELIFKSEIQEIREVMKRSREQGMITFDQALFDLHERELISYEDALRNADSVNDLRLQIKLNSKLFGGVAGIHRGIEHLGLTGS